MKIIKKGLDELQKQILSENREPWFLDCFLGKPYSVDRANDICE